VAAALVAEVERLEPGGPDLLRYRDLYLEPWTGFAPLPELRRLFSHAYSLGTLCRALTWHRLISSLDEEVQAEMAARSPLGSTSSSRRSKGGLR